MSEGSSSNPRSRTRTKTKTKTNSSENNSNLKNTFQSQGSNGQGTNGTISLISSNDHQNIEQFIQKYILLLLIFLQMQNLYQHTTIQNEQQHYVLYITLLRWMDSQIIMTWRTPFGRLPKVVNDCSFGPKEEGDVRGIATQIQTQTPIDKNEIKNYSRSSQSGAGSTKKQVVQVNGIPSKTEFAYWKNASNYGIFLFSKILIILIILLAAFKDSGLVETLHQSNSTTKSYHADENSNHKYIEYFVNEANSEVGNFQQTRPNNANSFISSSNKTIFDNSQFWTKEESSVLKGRKGYLSSKSIEFINFVTNTPYLKQKSIINTSKFRNPENIPAPVYKQLNVQSQMNRVSNRILKGMEQQEQEQEVRLQNILNNFNPVDMMKRLTKKFFKEYHDPDPVLKNVRIKSSGICAPHPEKKTHCLDKKGQLLLSELLENLHKYEPTFIPSNVIAECSKQHLNANRQAACVVNSTERFKPINPIKELTKNINFYFGPAKSIFDNIMDHIKTTSYLNEKLFKLYYKLNSYISWYLNSIDPGWTEREDIRVPRDILKSYFTPTRSHEQFHNEGGLELTEIRSTLVQYERVYSDFVLFPDFEMRVTEGSFGFIQKESGNNKAFYEMDVKHLLAAGKYQIGSNIAWTFDFDNSNNSNSNNIDSGHSGALYINLDKNDKRFGFYHHESYAVLGNTPDIHKLYRNIRKQLRSIHSDDELVFPLRFNEIEKQVNNGDPVTKAKRDRECGVYTMYFIVKSLESGRKTNIKDVYDSIHVDAKDAMIKLRKETFFREVMY